MMNAARAVRCRLQMKAYIDIHYSYTLITAQIYSPLAGPAMREAMRPMSNVTSQ